MSRTVYFHIRKFVSGICVYTETCVYLDIEKRERWKDRVRERKRGPYIWKNQPHFLLKLPKRT